MAEGKVAVGDKITSVNGTTTEGKSYREVRGEEEREVGRWGEGDPILYLWQRIIDNAILHSPISLRYCLFCRAVGRSLNW